MKNTVYSGNIGLTYHQAYSSWNKKTRQNTTSTAVSCNLSLQFRNTSYDKLAFDRCERVGRIIRPALLKTRSLATERAGAVKICRPKGLWLD